MIHGALIRDVRGQSEGPSDPALRLLYVRP